MQTQPLCIYHGHCTDGQGAAAAFYLKYPEADFYQGFYQEPPPDVEGRDVYLVDFSYPREVVEQMLTVCKSLTIIDHHKTAIEALQDLQHDKLRMVFAMHHSGAVLTFKYLNPSAQIPEVLRYIEDRDLWQFKYPWTKAITAWLYSQPFDIKEWAKLLTDSWFKANVKTWVAVGEALVKQDTDRIQHLMANKRMLTIQGHEVPAVNASGFFRSDLGHALAVGNKFGVVYFDVGSVREFHLRSDKDAEEVFDVSAVAMLYGGGGHASAAGFKVEISKLVAEGLL